MSTITNSQPSLFGGPNTQNGLQQLLQDRRNQAAPIDSGNNLDLMDAHKQALSEARSDRTQTLMGQLIGDAGGADHSSQDVLTSLRADLVDRAKEQLSEVTQETRDRGFAGADENAKATHADIRNMTF